MKLAVQRRDFLEGVETHERQQVRQADTDTRAIYVKQLFPSLFPEEQPTHL